MAKRLMKKWVAPLAALIIGIVTFAPQKAEAGMLITIWGASHPVPASEGEGYDPDNRFMVPGVLMSVVAIGLPNTPANGLIKLGLFLLDLDASLPTDQLVEEIQKHLPFIDNKESLQNLATTAKAKFKAQVELNPEAKSVYVTLSRDEVEQALAHVDISSEQNEQVVKFFQ